jgi:hypothetical protein
VANAFDVIAKRKSFRPGSDNQNISSVDSAIESAIQQDAVEKAAGAEGNHDQPNRDQNDTPRNVICMKQVKRTGQHQPGCKASPEAEVLLVEMAIESYRRVQVKSSADDNKRNGKAKQDG